MAKAYIWRYVSWNSGTLDPVLSTLCVNLCFYMKGSVCWHQQEADKSSRTSFVLDLDKQMQYFSLFVHVVTRVVQSFTLTFRQECVFRHI